MVDLAKLDELIARVERATGADREIDLALWDVFVRKWTGLPYEAGSAEAGPYTESMDAALGLVERMLPGWDYGLDRDEGQFFATLAPTGGSMARGYQAEGKSLPLAIILALLRALRESSERGR